MIRRKGSKQRNNQIQEKVLSVLDVRGMVITSQNVLHISRGNKKATMYPGLMTKRNQMKKVPIMLLFSQEDVTLRRIPMERTSLMMNCLNPMKAYARIC